MKKLSVIALALVIALSLAVLVSCADAKIYDELNEMAQLEYSKLTLEVNYKGYAELNAKFDCTFSKGETKVEYSYDKLNKIDVSDGITLPENGIETVSGAVTVKDGFVTSLSTDQWDVDIDKLSVSGLSFVKDYFDNVETTETSFKADVINEVAFMGDCAMNYSRMKVAVEFIPNQTYFQIINNVSTPKTGSILSKMVITYLDTAQNAEVTLTYTLTK